VIVDTPPVRVANVIYTVVTLAVAVIGDSNAAGIVGRRKCKFTPGNVNSPRDGRKDAFCAAVSGARVSICGYVSINPPGKGPLPAFTRAADKIIKMTRAKEKNDLTNCM
jgi:hypothetical protein